MVYLITYPEQKSTFSKKENANREEILMRTIEEAIQEGQQTGLYYEVYDPQSGRVIDWNEVNIHEQEEWFYDEHDMIWKKGVPEEYRFKPLQSLFEWVAGIKGESYACNLSY